MANSDADDKSQLDGFIEKWELDTRAARFLREMSPAQQAKACERFSPNANTNNPSAKFIQWVRRTGASHGNGKSTAVEDRMPIGAGPKRSAANDIAPAAPASLADKGPEEIEQLVSSFVEKWSLDDTGKTLLSELPADIKLAVLQGFSPGPNTRDCGRKLQAYVRKLSSPKVSVPSEPNPASSRSLPVANGRALGKGMSKSVPVGAKGSSPPAAASLQKGGKGGHRSLQAKPSERVAKWGLNEEAHKAFSSLPHNAQVEVLDKFSLPIGAENGSQRLLAFLKRRASSGKGASAQTVGSTASHPAPRQGCGSREAAPEAEKWILAF